MLNYSPKSLSKIDRKVVCRSMGYQKLAWSLRANVPYLEYLDQLLDTSWLNVGSGGSISLIGYKCRFFQFFSKKKYKS